MADPFSAPDAGLYPPGRLQLAAKAADQAGLSALLLTPGPDLRYVIGYDAPQLERLTCLAVPAGGDPFLVVPRLELPAAQASPAGGSGLRSSRGTSWTIRTSWSRRGSGGRVGRAVGPDVGADGAAVPRGAARGRTGPGLGRAARAALKEDPGRGGRAARGRGGHRPGARRGAGLAAGRPHRAGGGGGHRPGHHGRGARTGRLRHRRVRAQRGQPASRAVRPGAAAG